MFSGEDQKLQKPEKSYIEPEESSIEKFRYKG